MRGFFIKFGVIRYLKYYFSKISHRKKGGYPKKGGRFSFTLGFSKNLIMI